MTFTEIMIGVFLMAIALLPIIQMLSRTTGATRNERTEAAAAAYAGKLMNQFLYEYKWENLSGDLSGTGYLDNDPKTNVMFKWNGTVTDAWPVNNSFSIKQTKYHHGCGGICTAAIEDPLKKSPAEINPSFCALAMVGNVVFKQIHITFQWKGPGDSDFNEVRKVHLVVRRGVLFEPNQ